MAKYSKATRQTYLGVIHALMKQVNKLFYEFRKDCKHRNNAGCSHKDYHKDFTLANICGLENCPVMEEED